MALTPYITDDGSMSFRNLSYDEMYHTKSGAKQEALQKHALPLKPWEKNNPIIYDICFGIGYNAAAAIDLIRKNNNNSLITVYCLENDIEILRKILEIEDIFESFPLIKRFVAKFDLEHTRSGADNFTYIEENIKLVMLFGDARIKIHDILQNADFVFFDPFSPKTQPEMWNTKFYSDINSKMNPGAKLTTYSYARKVREDLANSGFIVIDGPTIGRISPSTIAIKK